MPSRRQLVTDIRESRTVILKGHSEIPNRNDSFPLELPSRKSQTFDSVCRCDIPELLVYPGASDEHHDDSRDEYIPHEGVRSTTLPHDMHGVSIDPGDVVASLGPGGRVGNAGDTGKRHLSQQEQILSGARPGIPAYVDRRPRMVFVTVTWNLVPQRLLPPP